MKKKPIDELTKTPRLHQLLFAKAQAIAKGCQTINTHEADLTEEQRKVMPQIAQQQMQLQTSLRAAITAFGKLTQVQKAPLATPVDHGLDIFEAITDNIETAAQKFRLASKNASTGKPK